MATTLVDCSFVIRSPFLGIVRHRFGIRSIHSATPMLASHLFVKNSNNVARSWSPPGLKLNYGSSSAGHGSDEKQIDLAKLLGQRNYDVVRPAVVSPPRTVPSHIQAPNYHDIGRSFRMPKKLRRIDRKSETDLVAMRDSCTIAKKILNLVESKLCIGMSTDEIDELAHEEIIAHQAYPSPLHYRGFPKSVCTSVNNVACHGIPDSRRLLDGDLLNVDVTVFYRGFHGDCSATFAVGDVDESGLRLIEGARRCRDEAIKACGPGKPFSIIGKTISAMASSLNLKIIPLFCGHGIGTYFHGKPDILHIDNDLAGTMEEGMTFTIEPVICEGSSNVIILEDGWTAVTPDHSRSAQFEHTILITSQGVDILTK